MSMVTVVPEAIIPKKPVENRVIEFNWADDNLATGVTITTSTFTLTVIRPEGETPVALANDNASILSGSRKTETRLTGGTLGSLYKVTNTIVTSESPTQTKSQYVYVQVY